ncbi:hypothetical protein F53441_14380 [Fusarium austroafricanum]|uniref:CCHC-type domain-containing protein n=1 Tax=Fusarium austroafricanum TaxID=2364996 RepID=A0A8H4NKR7_9HYPO|nr:hypothetical protein F53441_14380 [Fusarium austroafricanum]
MPLAMTNNSRGGPPRPPASRGPRGPAHPVRPARFTTAISETPPLTSSFWRENQPRVCIDQLIEYYRYGLGLDSHVATGLAKRIVMQMERCVSVKVICDVKKAREYGPFELLNKCHLEGDALSNVLAVHIPLHQNSSVLLIFKSETEASPVRSDSNLSDLARRNREQNGTLNFVRMFEYPERQVPNWKRETGIEFDRVHWRYGQLWFRLLNLDSARKAVSINTVSTLNGLQTRFVSRDPRSIAMMCNHCHGLGHMKDTCPNRDVQECKHCLKQNHQSDDCWSKLDPVCRRCLRQGHASWDLRSCHHPSAINAIETARLFRGPAWWDTEARGQPYGVPVQVPNQEAHVRHDEDPFQDQNGTSIWQNMSPSDNLPNPQTVDSIQPHHPAPALQHAQSDLSAFNVVDATANMSLEDYTEHRRRTLREAMNILESPRAAPVDSTITPPMPVTPPAPRTPPVSRTSPMPRTRRVLQSMDPATLPSPVPYAPPKKYFPAMSATGSPKPDRAPVTPMGTSTPRPCHQVTAVPALPQLDEHPSDEVAICTPDESDQDSRVSCSSRPAAGPPTPSSRGSPPEAIADVLAISDSCTPPNSKSAAPLGKTGHTSSFEPSAKKRVKRKRSAEDALHSQDALFSDESNSVTSEGLLFDGRSQAEKFVSILSENRAMSSSPKGAQPAATISIPEPQTTPSPRMSLGRSTAERQIAAVSVQPPIVSPPLQRTEGNSTSIITEDIGEVIEDCIQVRTAPVQRTITSMLSTNSGK